MKIVDNIQYHGREQYELIFGFILCGEYSRTTLMSQTSMCRRRFNLGAVCWPAASFLSPVTFFMF
jgi:hypothetical protein